MEKPPATPTVRHRHRVAIYDMDRTITHSGTYSGFLIHVALRRQPWRLLLLPLIGLAGAAYALRLIDYEFACVNPRAFDVANFFLECAFVEETEEWNWGRVPPRVSHERCERRRGKRGLFRG